MEELTDKQKRFCEEYIIDLNATAAAARAGYSDPNYGRQILTIPNVLEHIEKLQKERSGRTRVTADRVITEFAKIGFADIRKFTHNDWTIKLLSEIDETETACIQSIKTTVNEGSSTDGKIHWKKTTVEFKLHSKQAALDSLAKHTGIYKADNLQKAEGITLHIEEGIIKKMVADNEESEA